MPPRKQRRRREKERRHDYEYVLVDGEGQEVESGEEPAAPEPKVGSKVAARARSSSKRGGSPGRRVAPPSWRRVARRALIFAPFMFLTLTFIAEDLTTTGRLIQTVILLAFFLPFSFLMDTMMYRSYLRKGGQPEAEPSERRRSRGLLR